MHPFRHWTPRYIIDRLVEKRYRQSHPNFPWLTPTANELLEQYLQISDCGMEFGSGKSTLWFAKKCSHLTSVEHNPVWFKRVQQWIAEERVANVSYFLRQRTEKDGSDGVDSEYVGELKKISPASLDFVLVDGIFRAACALTCIEYLKPGGVILIDNVNLHIPCKSHAPNSCTEQSGPSSLLWTDFIQLTASWRRIWTSNGISDTAFYFKPGRTAPRGEA
jgi:predicted O-methyltransferase YrrM